MPRENGRFLIPHPVGSEPQGEYPISSILVADCTLASTAGSYSTVALEVAKLTAASLTPSSVFNPSSMRRTHAAQLIPSIAMVLLANLEYRLLDLLPYGAVVHGFFFVK